MKTIQYDCSYHKDEVIPTGKNFLLDFDPFKTPREHHKKDNIKSVPHGDSMCGSRFGNWEVLKFTRVNGSYERYYLCRCKCGKEREIIIRTLLTGKSLSCGCARLTSERALNLRTQQLKG